MLPQALHLETVRIMPFAVIVTANTALHLGLLALAVTSDAFRYSGHAHALSIDAW